MNPGGGKKTVRTGCAASAVEAFWKSFRRTRLARGLPVGSEPSRRPACRGGRCGGSEARTGGPKGATYSPNIPNVPSRSRAPMGRIRAIRTLAYVMLRCTKSREMGGECRDAAR